MSEPHPVAGEWAALREQFMAQAGAAFDLMFHPEHQHALVAFHQREAQVVDLIRHLGAWLLQNQANADPAAQPDPARVVLCPRCGRPAGPADDPDDPLPRRPLTTLTGQVELRRQRFSCTTCRVVFFPPRP